MVIAIGRKLQGPEQKVSMTAILPSFTSLALLTINKDTWLNCLMGFVLWIPDTPLED